MTHPIVGRLVTSALLLLLTAGVASATPATYTRNLSFSTGTESLWGPGQGTASFGASGSAGIPQVTGPFDVQITPGLGVSYDFGASSGTASANVNGSLEAQYDDYLLAPGVASITLDYATSSGGFGTDLGANIDIEGYVDRIPFGSRWDFCFYCAGPTLNTSSSSRPDFGVTRTDTDSISLAGVGPSFLSLASAQMNLNATQRSNLRLDEFTGVMTYENLDTGTNGLLGFALDQASVLDVLLPEAGEWRFGFLDLDLDNTFWSTMGGSLSLDIDVFGVIDESWSFASLDLLDTPRFALDFGELDVASAFSITVPEPGSGWLLASGLVGLAFAGRRRNAAA